MECDVIVAHRCNAHCQMRQAGKNPSKVEEQILFERKGL